MRLLKRDQAGRLSLQKFYGKGIPRYAILSHTWGLDKEEVSFKDIARGSERTRANYVKIEFCLNQAERDGLQYIWVDTCCIKKSSDAELTEAINSMYRWYRAAAKCYVYLSDVSSAGSVVDDWMPAFRKSRWFTRGWTLQELLAPSFVEFFCKDELTLGDKRSLEPIIHEITGIAIPALQGSLASFRMEERLSWARNRETKREEDAIYSLLGICGVYMPLIYGEGRWNSYKRLMKTINEDNFRDRVDDLSYLTQLPHSTKGRMHSSKHSMDDAQVDFPADLGFRKEIASPSSDLDRKETAMKKSNHYIDSKSSLAVDVSMPLEKDTERFGPESLTTLEFEKQRRILRNIVYIHSLTSSTYLRKRVASRVYQCNWLAKSFGIIMHIVSSRKSHGSICTFYSRWPINLPFWLGQNITIWLTVRDMWPSLPNVVLTPQNVISSTSRIIDACKMGDLTKIRELLQAKEAHPNDRTIDGITVFRHAIRSGKPEAVRLLLDHGANPNLHFGTFETSPLNNAFFVGNVAIIRMLLEAGADLDYWNRRSWSSISYLWDPGRSSHRDTSEILDICVEQGFSDWNDTDMRGWSAVHRASAYGCGDDIWNLAYKGANMHAYTTDDLWGPVTCAVWNKNESTFNALADMLSEEETTAVVDSRGWTLLHLAAQTGSGRIMRRLMEIGVSLGALTMPTIYWVTENLAKQQLTAETIAREYGHGEIWDHAINNLCRGKAARR